MLYIQDAEQLQGLSAGFTGVEGLSDSKRMKFIANSVPVPMGKWIGNRVANPYTHKYNGININDGNMDHLITIPKSADAPKEELDPWTYIDIEYLQDGMVLSNDDNPGPSSSKQQQHSIPTGAPDISTVEGKRLVFTWFL
jgi:hypothetical protein